MVDIIVDVEFTALCPALMADEYTGLEASILADGCRDALAVWATGNILLDGHNRKAICDKHRLPYKVAYLRKPYRRPLAKTGDSDKEEIVGEATLEDLTGGEAAFLGEYHF